MLRKAATWTKTLSSAALHVTVTLLRAFLTTLFSTLIYSGSVW